MSIFLFTGYIHLILENKVHEENMLCFFIFLSIGNKRYHQRDNLLGTLFEKPRNFKHQTKNQSLKREYLFQNAGCKTVRRATCSATLAFSVQQRKIIQN
jgi:hypothetical protein